MKFGKLADISAVDFTIPEEPASNEKILGSLGPSTECMLYVGCTGWSMPQWKGSYYPASAPAKDFLKHYSQQFNTIEFNTTHYNIPKVETVKKWRTESADDFLFCPKVYKFISHTKNLGIDGDNIIRMVDSLAHLEEKLGPMFMQLPPYFDTERLAVLERFLERWPAGQQLAIELRHASWYESESALADVQNLLTSHGHSLLITDVAGRRDLMHMRLCGDSLMVRWVGNGLHPSDYRRIDEWLDRIRYYASRGLKSVYFFTHEPDNILAPDIAAYLCSKVTAESELITRGPQKLSGASQLKLF